MSSPFSGEQPLGELGDAAAQVAGLRAVLFGHFAVGGGAVVGAGAAHPLRPGRADEEQAVGEEQVEELEEGGLRAAGARPAGGEGGADLAGELAGLPQVAGVVHPVLELYRNAAPVRTR